MACLCTMLLLFGCNESSSSKKSYPNARLLADAGDVGDTGVVLLDTRGTDAYNAGHIPGAVNLQWGGFADGSTNLKPVDQLEDLLGAAGLTRESKIIIYDDTTASWGAAGRLFWMFEYLGCKNVRILNGGWDKWVADGRSTETASTILPPAVFIASLNESVVVDGDHIADRLDDDDFVIIDTRTDEEFIGWQLYGEARGGHIEGAVHLPYAWYFKEDKTLLDFAELKNLFENHGITRDKEVTAYCTVGIRSAFAYFLARLMGYDRAANYDGSIKDWAARNETLYPMEKAQRFSTIVNPAWIKAVIDYHATGSISDAPAEYPYGRDHHYLIFETQWGGLEYADAYKAGHIPGAIHSDSDIYENGFPRWFLIPDNELHAIMGSMGITADTTVIVYSDSPIFAARLWWILKYAGVADVRYLNGGYEKWSGMYAGETSINPSVPATFSGTVNPDFRATTAYVEAANRGDVYLADVRSYDEFIGKISGYGYLAMTGRIPGALWARDADDASPVYGDPDGTLRSFTEVRDHWKTSGIQFDAASNKPNREVMFYCGGGYRSALTFLYGYLMGYDAIRNYSDGWAGWSTDFTEDPSCTDSVTPGWCQDPSGRPVETGLP